MLKHYTFNVSHLHSTASVIYGKHGEAFRTHSLIYSGINTSKTASGLRGMENFAALADKSNCPKWVASADLSRFHGTSILSLHFIICFFYSVCS